MPDVTSGGEITGAASAEAELRALIDNLPELAWTARPDGFIDFYNRRWYEFSGATFADTQGWGWQAMHDPRELPRVVESWTRSIATQEPFEQSFPLRRKDGVFRWFLTRVAPMFDDAGKLIRWVGINTDIDDQRRDQEAAHEAEQRFRLVFESSPVGMIKMDAEGRIVLVNAQTEALFGYAREELVGQPIETLVPARFRGHHPGYREGFLADPRSRAMGAGRDLYGLRKDGSEVAVEIGLNPLGTPDGFAVLGTVVDVSARKRAEKERIELVEQLRALNAALEERVRSRTSELSQTLREREDLLRQKTSLLEERERALLALRTSEADFRLLAESMPQIVWVTQPDGKNIYFNERWTSYTGLTREESLGDGWNTPFHPDDKQRAWDAWQAATAGRGIYSLECRLRRADGAYLWWLIRGVPVLDASGNVRKWFGTCTDIDAMKRSEESARQRTLELAETLREREALLREKTSLLQEVHHRVKNNLQMMSSLFNLQARQIRDKDARAIFLESQGRVRSIALLHESLYQAGDLGRVDMQEYVDKLVATLQRVHGESGSGTRFLVEIDRVYLPIDAAVPCGLIINELVTNALKHAFVPDGAGKEIRVEMRRVDDRLVLTVADNGAGFPPAVHPSHDETMGLTLVRDLSLQLGGDAEFATVNGARCTVRFPARTGTSAGHDPVEEARPRSPS